MGAFSGALEGLAARADIPAAAMTGLPTVTVEGAGSVIIANHRGLLEYGGDMVEVDGGRLRLRIRGAGLVLVYMTREELKLRGQIFSLDFE